MRFVLHYSPLSKVWPTVLSHLGAWFNENVMVPGPIGRSEFESAVHEKETDAKLYGYLIPHCSAPARKAWNTGFANKAWLLALVDWEYALLGFAVGFLHQNIFYIINICQSPILSRSQYYFILQDIGLQDTAVEVLHTLLSYLVKNCEENSISTETKESFLVTLRSSKLTFQKITTIIL